MAVESRRITYPTRRTAIEAFIGGYTKVRNTRSRDHQWNFVAATPVRLLDNIPGRAPLTVGVMCIQSNLPWTYVQRDSLYGGGPLVRQGGVNTPYERVDGSPAPVTAFRLAHEQWVATKPRTGHAPLDTVLTGLAKSARGMVLDQGVKK